MSNVDSPMPLLPTRFSGVPVQSTNPAQAAINMPVGGGSDPSGDPSDPSSPSRKRTKTISPEQQLINQWNTLTKTLLSSQVNGPQASSIAAKLANIANQLPYETAQGLLKKLPQNTQLSGFVSQYMQNPSLATQTASAQPASAYDPLALQTMWHDVFGPLMNTMVNAKGTGSSQTVGSNYASAMNQALAGSNLPANERSQLTGQNAATGQLMQQIANQQAGSVATQPSYDQMINWLQQATGAAQLAQGEYEKNVSYGQTAPLLGANASPVPVPGSAGNTLTALLGGGASSLSAQSQPQSQYANPLAPHQLP